MGCQRLAVSHAVQASRRLSAAAALPPPSVGRLNHVAIAVPNLREAAAKYREVLGVKVRCCRGVGLSWWSVW